MATVRVGDLLKSKGALNDRQLEVALSMQKITGDLLGATLVKLGFITSKELGQILAQQIGIEFIDLGEYAISEEALKIIPKDIAEKAEFIPLNAENGRLSIGIINPSNILAIDTVARMTKVQPSVYVVDADNYRDTLESAYFFLENPIQSRIENAVRDIAATEAVSGAAITSITDLLIMDGVRRRATDIHVNPTTDIVTIFYRVDGVLQHGHSLPKKIYSGLVSRIKILSQLDIAEQRLPQDGSFTFKFLNKSYDLRVSTAPTIYGETVVLRILGGLGGYLKIEVLGFDSKDIGMIKKLFHKPHGVILMTGPTGSGKTSTLYAALREIDMLQLNIITVEDPVEYKLSLIKQTQVNEKVGYNFALAGRNFMRQDPDVMLLGEIRDEETAKIAVRAAITGHLVLSTLHTNDAITAIPRLIDLGLDRFSISSALLAVLAQRLVRKVCSFCKKEYALNDSEASVFKDYGLSVSTAFRADGCVHCHGTGYSGRTVIGELLVVDDEIRELIFSGASFIVMKEAATRKGMRMLKEDGMTKAAAGITTLDEVNRVAG